MGDQYSKRYYPPLLKKKYYLDNCNIEDLVEWLTYYFEEKKRRGYKSAYGITRILSVRHIDSKQYGNRIKIEGDYNGYISPLPDDLDYLTPGTPVFVLQFSGRQRD